MDENISNELRMKLIERINGLSSAFKINYPLNPNCKYKYPPINSICLQNIVNALISNKKFYTQTLHLMNKMNLPCPFVPNSFTHNAPQQSFNIENLLIDKIGSEPMTIVDSTTSESEIENENEIIETTKTSVDKLIRTKKLKVKPSSEAISEMKKERLLNIDQVFDLHSDESISKVKSTKEQLKLTSNKISNDYELIEPIEKEGFGRIAPKFKSKLLEEENKEEEEESDDADQQQAGFISREELEKNRLKPEQLKELSAFKNYDKGEVNQRLYIKNLAKKVEESHLKYIYGRYIDWSNETHKNAFDIRLMQEGRMKGQAFVTLPSDELANKALDQTNGYMLLDKPLIVQFARSAKPKQT